MSIISILSMYMILNLPTCIKLSMNVAGISWAEKQRNRETCRHHRFTTGKPEMGSRAFSLRHGGKYIEFLPLFSEWWKTERLLRLFRIEKYRNHQCFSPFDGLLSQRGVPDWHPAPAALVEACQKAVQHCASKGYPIEKLAMQYSVSNPRIATTLFSSANPENVRKNIQYIEDPIDWDLVREVQEISRPKRVSWSNSWPENKYPLRNTWTEDYRCPFPSLAQAGYGSRRIADTDTH